jgi:hypothetical protein
MRCLSNSNVESHSAKRVDIASDEYTTRVASPVMDAVDHMPQAYRELVNEYGYVDVYRAWKRGWTPAQIRQRAVNGTFHFS